MHDRAMPTASAPPTAAHRGNGFLGMPFSEDRLVAPLRRAAVPAHHARGDVACSCLGRACRDVRRTANRISRAVTTARTGPARPGGVQFSGFYDTPAHRAASGRVSRPHEEQRPLHTTRTFRRTGVLRATLSADRTPTADPPEP
ncbi:hypothetical protein ACIQJT_11990 [Streptomyces sp. NPDC091972]|uniref:hypothetical protein n=1 Tax=Streptomyces sp. NPDC091972 TaxID=3366007 RepID=UPI00382919AA